jgi:predicted DNA-binding protein YlxM (UPF0122 family)
MFSLVVIHLEIKKINQNISSYEKRLALYKDLGEKILVDIDQKQIELIQNKINELKLIKKRLNYLKLFFWGKL